MFFARAMAEVMENGEAVMEELPMACTMCGARGAIERHHRHYDEKTGWSTHYNFCKTCSRETWRDHTKLELRPKDPKQWQARNIEYVERLESTVRIAQRTLYR